MCVCVRMCVCVCVCACVCLQCYLFVRRPIKFRHSPRWPCPSDVTEWDYIYLPTLSRQLSFLIYLGLRPRWDSSWVVVFLFNCGPNQSRAGQSTLISHHLRRLNLRGARSMKSPDQRETPGPLMPPWNFGLSFLSP